MFVKLHTQKQRGFTLVELAIVLAVAAILFAGLWRLMSSGGQQLRDQAAATQHQQIISSLKAYFSSSSGQSYLASQMTAAAHTVEIPLPAQGKEPTATDVATCRTTPEYVADANLAEICSYLPLGTSAVTTNSYNQTYTIRLRLPVGVVGRPPSSYSFMIMSQNGETIPDVSGGRLASLIGGDGGFVYSTAEACTEATKVAANLSACGSFGSWSVATTDYAIVGDTVFGIANGGHVASRTFISGDMDSTSPWLARMLMAGDTTFFYNTMTTSLYIHAPDDTATVPNNLVMGGAPATKPALTNNLYMGATSTAIAGGGQIALQNGCISGTNDCATTLGTLPVAPTGGLLSDIEIGFMGPRTGSAALTVYGTPSADKTKSALYVSGDVNIAGSLWASSFIYGGTTSDERKKTDITNIKDALEKLGQIKAVSFKMKDDGKPGLGVIAQNVQKVYPELVVENEDGYLGVNYYGFIGPLIGAVQELKAENDKLRRDVSALSSEIKKIRKK